MRDIPHSKVERCRVRAGKFATSAADGNNGLFLVVIKGVRLKAIVSDGGSWDHVSVSLEASPNRCPTWEEMAAVKRMFFKDSETVVQFHPAADAYVNYHKYVLHLWRDQRCGHVLPPSWMTGPKPGQSRQDVIREAMTALDQQDGES